MLEKIKSVVSEQYNLNDSRGIFFSLFDENKTLILSKWLFFTDKSLEEVITKICTGLLEKQTNTAWIGIDVIIDPQIETNPQILSNLDMQKYGIAVHALQNEKIGVLLPATAWITTIAEALQAIKTKNQIAWDAEIYTFTTERRLLSLK